MIKYVQEQANARIQIHKGNEFIKKILIEAPSLYAIEKTKQMIYGILGTDYMKFQESHEMNFQVN